jgi:uncharacterized protein (TIGR04255 family)
MPFPESDREIYNNNPLEQVICQLRFPTVLSISSEPPAKFQEEIRREYPWYAKQGSADIPDIPGAIRESLPPEIRNALPDFELAQVPISYTFENEDRTRAIQLTQDSVAVSDSRYDQWDEFRTEIERIESVLREIYAPAFYTRIGLRYRDILDRSHYGLESVPWSELLNPNFLGVLGSEEIAQDVVQSHTQVLLTIPDVGGGLVILQHGLIVRDGNDSPAYFIDADFSTQDRGDHDAAFKAANKFNRWAGHLFRWVATDYFRMAMQPRRSD